MKGARPAADKLPKQERARIHIWPVREKAAVAAAGSRIAAARCARCPCWACHSIVLATKPRRLID